MSDNMDELWDKEPCDVCGVAWDDMARRECRVHAESLECSECGSCQHEMETPSE